MQIIKDKKFDIDRLTRKELKDRIENINNNISMVENSEGIRSVLQLKMEYEKRLW